MSESGDKNNMADKTKKHYEKNQILEAKLQQNVTTFLDENLLGDFSNVRKCLERMKLQRSELEKQVC